MIVTQEILLDFLFDDKQSNINIDNVDEIKNYCKNYIHYPLLQQPKVKKDIQKDIVWTEDLKELIKRYKVLINKYGITVTGIFPFKINNVFDWLFDGGSVEIPPLFLYYKNELKGILWYLHNSFLKKIKFVKLLNEHANNLYDYNKELEILQFYKFIIQQQNVQRNELMQYFPKKNYRKEFVQRLNELGLADTGNANSLFELIKSGVFGQHSISDLIERSFGEKIDLKTDTVSREEILSILKNNDTEKLMNNDKVLKELNQEIIDELELTLFNVKTIKNKNLVLYIFIDKNNLKRYYYEPFTFTMFVSMDGNIINNDYIVDYNPNMHIAYTFTNYELVNKFKYLLNDTYKKHMKKYLK